jgi:hypothetical protein
MRIGRIGRSVKLFEELLVRRVKLDTGWVLCRVCAHLVLLTGWDKKRGLFMRKV